MFVDDIVVFSKNLDEHITHVKAAIQKLTEVKLILNPDKCHFAQSCVYLLGFCISDKGVSLDRRKVANVKDWPVPQTGHDIQKFLGVVNYLRKHIPKVSQLTAPLDALRNAGDLTNIWKKEHKRCFDNIRHAISSVPVLRYPDLSQPFCVATDASNDGIRAVLYQVIQNEICHIAFIARALSKSERNYSTTKRELLAVIFALNKFHQYIWGNHFTLYTDHKALVYLHTQKIANAMMINWLDTLLEYNFTVIHLPGINNVLPDQLSRLFPPVKELEGGNDPENKNKDEMDVEIAKIVRAAQMLDEKITPPDEDRQELLQNAHLFGHFGAESIVKRLQNDGLHWNNMQLEAVEVVKKCPDCQKYNIALCVPSRHT
jgi:hypothetical protein